MRSKLFITLCGIGLIGVSATVYGEAATDTWSWWGLAADGIISRPISDQKPQADCLETICEYGCVEKNGESGYCCPEKGQCRLENAEDVDLCCEDDEFCVNGICQKKVCIFGDTTYDNNTIVGDCGKCVNGNVVLQTIQLDDCHECGENTQWQIAEKESAIEQICGDQCCAPEQKCYDNLQCVECLTTSDCPIGKVCNDEHICEENQCIAEFVKSGYVYSDKLDYRTFTYQDNTITVRNFDLYGKLNIPKCDLVVYGLLRIGGNFGINTGNLDVNNVTVHDDGSGQLTCKNGKCSPWKRASLIVDDHSNLTVRGDLKILGKNDQSISNLGKIDVKGSITTKSDIHSYGANNIIIKAGENINVDGRLYVLMDGLVSAGRDINAHNIDAGGVTAGRDIHGYRISADYPSKPEREFVKAGRNVYAVSTKGNITAEGEIFSQKCPSDLMQTNGTCVGCSEYPTGSHSTTAEECAKCSNRKYKPNYGLCSPK